MRALARRVVELVHQLRRTRAEFQQAFTHTWLWLGGKDSYTNAERDAAHAVELYAADPRSSAPPR
ncbi:MAG: hypothetical protein ACRDTE_33675 [Pseudonocardiaceae bacterium]